MYTLFLEHHFSSGEAELSLEKGTLGRTPNKKPPSTDVLQLQEKRAAITFVGAGELDAHVLQKVLCLLQPGQ